ncbi:MAG: hypothetical protein WCC66_15950 [Rhizobiaceae bacterium]
MSERDALPARMLLRNGALLIIPPSVITFGLWGVLPPAYSPGLFWTGIPAWLGLLENLFRILVFALPGILYFGKSEAGQSFGWVLYAGGIAAYLGSYLLEIMLPQSGWSQSLIGFTAPAWSAAFWLAGIGLTCARSWLAIPWHRAIYLFVALCFLIFHVGHTGLVYFNTTR